MNENDKILIPEDTKIESVENYKCEKHEYKFISATKYGSGYECSNCGHYRYYKPGDCIPSMSK